MTALPELHGVLDTRGTDIVKAKIDVPGEAIFAGDHLIVRQGTAEPGDLVLAMAGDDATVMRYEPGARVLGLVVGMFRSLR